MKMSSSRRWLQQLQLLLFLCALLRGTHGWARCPDTNAPAGPHWDPEQTLEPADALFDGEVCGPEGLQWACFLRGSCVGPTILEQEKFSSVDNVQLKEKANCPALFAIQARSHKQWRIVMQAKVARGESIIFKASCADEFECKYDGVTIKGRSGYNKIFTKSELRGRYEGGTLMCDFVITSARGESKIELATRTNVLYTGIVTTKSEDEGYDDSKGMSDYVIHKIQAGCDLSLDRAIPTDNHEEEYKAVNIAYHNFSCPDSYSLRWRDSRRVINNTDPFHTTAGMTCIKGVNFQAGVLKVIDSRGVASPRTMSLDVHCARKKCKLCATPSCANTENCPELTNVSGDFDSCPQLKCKDEQKLFKFGGKVHPGKATCNGDKWMVGADEVEENVECVKVSCPDVRATVKTKDAEKFNFTDDRVVCKAEEEDIKYTEGKDGGRMTAIVCNYSIGAVWYEELKEPNLAPEPYTSSMIDCYAQDSTKQPATGNLLLFTGIGLGVLAAIIGVLLLICFLMRREKKRKAREAALKKAMKGSKSKESKLLSPTGSKSTMSRVTSTRSVTGAKKKQTGGKGGKTPEDNTPEERSRPGDRSAIVDTAELKKIEEDRRKTAAATAALLESSKVEDEPQPVPATGAGSGEVPVEMGKGSASLIPDATQQPEPVDAPPKLKNLQKKRLKKSKIIENTDVTQQATSTIVDKTQMPTASTQAPSMLVSKTQLGGPESDDEPETPMWHNKPAAAIPAAAADKKEEAPAAAASDRQKIADLPTAKKKESTKKTKSGKRTTSAEKVVRPNFLNHDTSDWEADFTSDKKKSNEEAGGAGSKESEKDERSKRTQQRAWARKTSTRIDPTQHIPGGNDSAEENN